MEAVRFEAAPERISASRHWVVEQARRAGAGTGTQWVLALLTTEAVTNAVEHGPEDGQVTVEVARGDAGWCVAVTDESPEAPVRLEVDPTAPHGRGVLLIDTLATRWGVQRHGANGKTVWFRVA